MQKITSFHRSVSCFPLSPVMTLPKDEASVNCYFNPVKILDASLESHYEKFFKTVDAFICRCPIIRTLLEDGTAKILIKGLMTILKATTLELFLFQHIATVALKSKDRFVEIQQLAIYMFVGISVFEIG